jgi:hypothetical protein
MIFIRKDLFPHKDASLIDNLYYTPIEVLVRMDKDRLRHFLARAKLVCRWIEGILDFVTELDTTNHNGRGE